MFFFLIKYIHVSNYTFLVYIKNIILIPRSAVAMDICPSDCNRLLPLIGSVSFNITILQVKVRTKVTCHAPIKISPMYWLLAHSFSFPEHYILMKNVCQDHIKYYFVSLLALRETDLSMS